MVYTLEHDGILRKDGIEVGKPEIRLTYSNHRGTMSGGKMPLNISDYMFLESGINTERLFEYMKSQRNDLIDTLKESYKQNAHRHRIGDLI